MNQRGCRNALRGRLVVLIVSACLLRTLFAAPASEPVRLTHDGGRKMTPVFIEGGKEVVYAAHERPNLVALVRLSLSNGSRELLHPAVASHQFDPAFSADGRLHGYARSATSPQMDLVIKDLRESKESVYRPRDPRATARSPSFAPDGSRVVFSLSDLQGHQLASVNAQGQEFKLLTRAAGENCWPSYSPDGTSIAFGSSRDGDFEIYVMDSDGNDTRRLTRSPGRDMRPAWSPDGKWIAFVSTRDGDEEVYVMGADGSNPRNITNHPARDTDPAWHPDGQRIIFVSDRDGGFDLYLAKSRQ
jgi:TolB protein